MGKLSLIAIFFILAFLSLQSQVDLNDNCTSAYTDIISLRFDDARVKLAYEKSEAPENLMVPYLENYMDFLTVFIGENEEDFDFLEKNKSNRIIPVQCGIFIFKTIKNKWLKKLWTIYFLFPFCNKSNVHVQNNRTINGCVIVPHFVLNCLSFSFPR